MEVRAKWAASAVAIAVVGGAVWLTGKVYHQGGSVLLADSSRANWSLMGAGKGGDTAAAPGQQGMRTPGQVRDRLFKNGSFQGTQPDGDCLVDAKGQLKADIALRRRFEYYLLGQGEVTVPEIRSLVAEDACAGKDPEVVKQMLAMWDKYWQLRTYAFQHTLNVNDRSTWMPAFDEQKTVRRQILGPVWADAFYSDEEAYFLNFVDQVDGKAKPQEENGPVPQLTPGKDPAAVFEERKKLYGEDAAKRLAQADAEWADWEKRFGAAKAEWERVGNAPELSIPQRKAAMDDYVERHFKNDEEKRRVRALLSLP